MNFTREQLQAAVHTFLAGHETSAERIRAVETALRGPAGKALREELGKWVVEVLPAEQVVPQVYKDWRPLVRDAMLFTVSRLSAARLAPKLIEQLELPADTPPETRLLHLIAKVPGLQKIGQVLARNRHFHPSLREALSQLENGIHDVEAAEIRAMVFDQLGPQVNKYAVEIEPELMCEASVSAVMRFTWLNPETGQRERGVFKVLKPYVPACFREDMALLQELTTFLAAKHPEYGSPLPETLTGVRHLLEREVDYPREQRTLVEARRTYGSLPGVRVPRLFKQLSTARITALSEENGVKVTAAFAHEPAERRRPVAEQLVETLIAAPIFAGGENVVIHADTHAGNLLYDEKRGELVVLDWALTERLTREQRRHISLFGILLVLRDALGVCHEIEALSLDSSSRPPALTAFLRQHVAEFIEKMPLKHLPGSMDAMRLLDRLALEGVRFPSSLLMFRKILFTLDGILHDIGAPNVHMDLIIARHVASRWARHWMSIGSPLTLMDWVTVQSSALLFGGRVWVKWAQSALGAPAEAS